MKNHVKLQGNYKYMTLEHEFKPLPFYYAQN